MDSAKVTDAVRGVAILYQSRIPSMKVIEYPLNGDFASFKNNLKKHCSKKWIFNIDADEMPSSFLIENIHPILESNDDLDVLIVPRWNIVEGITKEHINRWRWKYDEQGRINWPDWQMRIYKNKEEIQWKNKVHEVLEGFDKYAMLPDDKDYCLFHNKSIQRQEKQNDFYDTIG
jgi:glycosyltransferase involved in cell wall biosynthesis